jgi:hypothetical protein
MHTVHNSQRMIHNKQRCYLGRVFNRQNKSKVLSLCAAMGICIPNVLLVFSNDVSKRHQLSTPSTNVTKKCIMILSTAPTIEAPNITTVTHHDDNQDDDDNDDNDDDDDDDDPDATSRCCSSSSASNTAVTRIAGTGSAASQFGSRAAPTNASDVNVDVHRLYSNPTIRRSVLLRIARSSLRSS